MGLQVPFRCCTQDPPPVAVQENGYSQSRSSARRSRREGAAVAKQRPGASLTPLALRGLLAARSQRVAMRLVIGDIRRIDLARLLVLVADRQLAGRRDDRQVAGAEPLA